ncbi:AHH domain-containing protein [Microbulbifer sp. OS29]|uniref:AHH domain-containing protein n=1 Tax=Microbulbifer okhotskensis TaxID=2926617 RepID=A0A9X2J6R1_9GAMM|nr:AHH domain-containing protein [Microbulbifer okhotskensis]MCO1336508.1 AHH domain-containing protein [Microbulbifer okhotskensis]
MEYDHGKRITPHVWELSPLDSSIHQYEKRCKEHHSENRVVPGETKEQRTQRLAKYDDAKEHLKGERARIMSMVSVQEQLREQNKKNQLQQYRDEFKGITGGREKLKAYKDEDHHPTNKLEDNLRLAGRAKPSSRYTAHHIVLGKGNLPITTEVRLTLFLHDIRINDPDNGVWMPRSSRDSGHWAMPDAYPHSRLHTHNYERWVHGQVNNLNSESEIRAKLTIVRTHLKNGTEPDKVKESSDPTWNGQ